MSVADRRGAARKMKLRYCQPHRRSIAESIAAEQQKAARAVIHKKPGK